MTPNRSQKIVKQERGQKLNSKNQSLKQNIVKTRIDQQRIRKGQMNVKQRFDSIKQECNHFKKEINIIFKQTTIIKIKLTLIFQILKAREVGDFFKATNLTHFLRFVQ